MALIVKQKLLSSNFIIYPFLNSSWLIPLGDFSDKLGFAIDLSTRMGQAEGFVISPDRRFKLDTASCLVSYNNRSEKYDCSQVFVREEDIYVSLRLLKKWLPVNITVDSFMSRVVIDPREKLPFQEKEDREKKAAGLLNSDSSTDDPQYPFYKTPRTWLDGFSIDQQINTRYSKSAKGDSTMTGNSSTLGSGELFGFETTGSFYTNFPSTQNTIGAQPTHRVTFSRHDLDGNLLGPAHLQEIQLYSVNLPSLDLITRSSTITGAYLSSYPLQSSSQFSSQDFQGELPPDWEVELYQNDIFIGRQTSSSSHQYRFQKIPLLYGVNRFKLIFYGPQGQRKIVNKTYNINPNISQPNQSYYRLGVGSEDTGTPRYFFQYDRGLFRGLNLTLGAAKYTYQDIEYPVLGYLKAQGFLQALYYSLGTSFLDKNHWAYQAQTQYPISTVILGASYLNSRQFQSEALPDGATLKNRTSLDLSFPIPFFRTLQTKTNLTRTELITGDFTNSAQNQLTTNLFGILFFNQLSYLINSNNTTSANLTGLAQASKWSSHLNIQLGMNYDSQSIQNVQESLLYRTSDKFSLNLTLMRSFQFNSFTGTFALNYTPKPIRLSATTSYSTTGDYSISSLMSFNLTRDPAQGKLDLYSNALSSSSSVAIHAYEVKRKPYSKKTIKKGVEKVKIRLTGGSSGEATTNKRGYAFLTKVQPNMKTFVNINTSKLENTFLRSPINGAKVYPRTGKTTVIDLPFYTVGTIEGTIFTKDRSNAEKPKRGVHIILKDITGKVLSKTKTNSDGFYSFEEIKPGHYLIVLDQKYLKEFKVKPIPELKRLTIPEEGSFESGADFYLKPA